MKKLLIGLLALGAVSAFAGNTPYEKASKLSEANISCQQYRATLNDLLSENPLNFDSIEIIRDLYIGCVDSLTIAIENGSSDSRALAQELQSKRMICDVETREIEGFLSVGSGDLDFEAIRNAKKELEMCKEKAVVILNN